MQGSVKRLRIPTFKDSTFNNKESMGFNNNFIQFKPNDQMDDLGGLKIIKVYSLAISAQKEDELNRRNASKKISTKRASSGIANDTDNPRDDSSVEIRTNKRYNLRKRLQTRNISPVMDKAVEDEDKGPSEDLQEPMDQAENGAVSKRQIKPNQPEHVLINCELCSRYFSSNQNLEEHVLNYHVADKEFKCMDCNRLYITEEKLAKHRYKKHGKFHCPQCPSKFWKENNFKRHLKFHGEEDSEKLKCTYCKQIFVSPTKYYQHIKRHEDPTKIERRFSCEVCSKTFKTPSALRDHGLYHIDVRPHKCKICDKAFKLHKDLRDHMMTHEEAKPLKCHLCPKSFTKTRELQQHQASIHGGKKPFKCPICPKEYFRERDLVHRHLPSHSNERNFHCGYCVASFKTMGSLRQHQNRSLCPAIPRE